jgi:glycosyltransferase involved in cell wall biosynthesis
MGGPNASSQPRLAVVVDNLSTNCLGRGYLLAKLLAQDFQVRIVGTLPDGATIWPPCPRDEIPIEVLGMGDLSWGQLGRLASKLEADVLVASKPMRNSFGLALLAKRHRQRPLVLDIDDWEAGGSGSLVWARLLGAVFQPWRWRKSWSLALDRLASRADAVTVASTWLQARYGGQLLPHVRDPQALDPRRFTGASVRSRLGLEQSRIVLFLGTPRPHKGLEEAAAAVDQLRQLHARFLIVGAEADAAYPQTVLKQSSTVILHPPCSMSEAPEFLAAADVVVIPQRDTPFAQAQLPAKLIDAMAMARPIVATAVSDIPRLLEGCGLVVPPGDSAALVRAFQWVFDHPTEAGEMGLRARDRMVSELSCEAGHDILLGAVNAAIARHEARPSGRSSSPHKFVST